MNNISDVPRTGLFWYIPGLFDGKWIIDFDHESHVLCWTELIQKGKVPYVDHTYYPRGRVIYKESTGTWFVIGDIVIITSVERKIELINLFGLPPEKVRFETSSAYISTYRAGK